MSLNPPFNIFDILSKDIPRKTYTKIDLIGKLHIIHALDNGQPKADIAENYGIHPQTITYIYKQKEALIRKYSQKINLLNEVQSMNLNQTLLDWIIGELKSGKIVKETHLREKAEELIKSFSEDFNCVDDWLMDFRRRNNIMIFDCEISCSTSAKLEWNNFVSNMDMNDLYIGGAFGLHHSLEIDKFSIKQETEQFVCLLILVNCSGDNKKELIVVGDKILEDHDIIKSLPVQYLQCERPCINFQIIDRLLEKWDADLKTQNRKITLILDVPDRLLHNFHCNNINIKIFRDMAYISKNITLIVKCFKYHYRRIQITKKLSYKNSNINKLTDYLFIMSAAWNSVPSEYIKRLLFPLENGSLYISTSDANDCNFSLSQWCKLHNLPSNLENHSESLDSYTQCDSHLQVISIDDNNETILNVNDSLLKNNAFSSSGVQAYQAIKRLINYLQSRNAGRSILTHAKNLEDQLEFGAFREIQQIMTRNASNE